MAKSDIVHVTRAPESLDRSTLQAQLVSSLEHEIGRGHGGGDFAGPLDFHGKGSVHYKTGIVLMEE